MKPKKEEILFKIIKISENEIKFQTDDDLLNNFIKQCDRPIKNELISVFTYMISEINKRFYISQRKKGEKF